MFTRPATKPKALVVPRKESPPVNVDPLIELLTVKSVPGAPSFWNRTWLVTVTPLMVIGPVRVLLPLVL